jgi:hypothetical protein
LVYPESAASICVHLMQVGDYRLDNCPFLEEETVYISSRNCEIRMASAVARRKLAPEFSAIKP